VLLELVLGVPRPLSVVSTLSHGDLLDLGIAVSLTSE